MLWYTLGIFLAVSALTALQKGRINGLTVETLILAGLLFAVTLFCWRKGWQIRPLKRGAMRPLTPGLRNEPGQIAQIVCKMLFSRGPEETWNAVVTQASIFDMPQEAIQKEVLESLPFLMDKAVEENRPKHAAGPEVAELLALAGWQIPQTENDKPAAPGTIAPDTIDPDTIAQATRLQETVWGNSLLAALLTDSPLPEFPVPQAPFELLKREKPLYLFSDVIGYTHTAGAKEVRDKTQPIAVGTHTYWRAADLETRIVRGKTLSPLGNGPLAVTDRHVYFMGGNTRMRIKHENITGIVPTSGTVILQRSAKPALEFRLDSPWLLANILKNIQSI